MLQFSSLLLILAGIVYFFGQCHNPPNSIIFNKNRIVDGYSQLYCDGGSDSQNNSSIVKLACNKICDRWNCNYNNYDNKLDDIRIYCNDSGIIGTCRMVYKLNKKNAKKTS